MSTHPSLKLPPWEMNACLLWPEWPAMNLSRGNKFRFLSHRAGGHYDATPDAKAFLLENSNEKYSKRLGLTTWLENQRLQEVFAPVITPEVISAIDPEQLPSIEDTIRRVLGHFERSGLGHQHTLRDDRTLAEKNLEILAGRPGRIDNLFEDARLLASSEYEDWNELGVIMDYLEKAGYVKKIPIADSMEWHKYSLTLEGLKEGRKADEVSVHSGLELLPLENGLPNAAAKDIFVVHGRNEEARLAISDFLFAIGLNPIQWETAVRETGQSSPYVGPILNAGLYNAQAAVVILTPDDIVTLSPVLHRPDDPLSESQRSGQPRPNVIFEAGMAMSQFENRTVIIEIGEIKRFSDIIGRHTIRLADTANCRDALASRLEVAGCPVDRSTEGWQHAGNFSAAIRMATECLGAITGNSSNAIEEDANVLLGHALADEARRPITKRVCDKSATGLVLVV